MPSNYKPHAARQYRAFSSQSEKCMMGFQTVVWPGLLGFVLAATTYAMPARAQQQQKPNILVIMADDIGYWNISAYNRGMMGYHTPNIDRIANEGAIFTDYYGQQSCTAGRAAFITGAEPAAHRTAESGIAGGEG